MSNLDFPDDFPKENCPFLEFEKERVTDRPTNHPSDRPTDTRSYRDRWTHLKRLQENIYGQTDICSEPQSKVFPRQNAQMQITILAIGVNSQ